MSLLMVCCTKNSEVKAAAMQEAGKTLVVYYSYTNNCHEIVTSLTSQIQADVMRSLRTRRRSTRLITMLSARRC